MRDAQYAPIASGIQAPLAPDGSNGVVQQGILDPGVAPGAAGDPIFTPFAMPAYGDELIVLAYPPSNLGNWDFAGSDLAFSYIYGTGNGLRATPLESTGVYVLSGTNRVPCPLRRAHQPLPRSLFASVCPLPYVRIEG